jgi:hypothetical protein
MTAKRQHLLLCFGAAIVALALWLWWLSATRLRPGIALEISPACGYFGVVLLAIVGVAKIRKKSTALGVAWLVRIANALFAFTMTVSIFFILPVNNSTTADLLDAVIQNSLLVVAACAFWWVTHRQLRLASERKMPNPAPVATCLAVTPAADAPVAPAIGRGSS